MLRLASPTKPISGSLHKVLAHLASIDCKTTIPRLCLAKTLFLLALASGSRFSELVALYRDEGNIIFYDSGLVKLLPDPTFLSKNKLPYQRRRRPLYIPALSHDRESLCPVANLKIYTQYQSHVFQELIGTHSGWGALNLGWDVKRDSGNHQGWQP